VRSKFDIAIIGSGLGGLLCGAILSKEGKRVCIVEKNEQLGGSLQTFKRDGVTFDTGVHYIGGLDPGQNLYSIFKYLGIIDRLELSRMAEDGFDVVLFDDDPQAYRYGMGYDNFIRIMSSYFPDEQATIRKYCFDMREICRSFPLYHLQSSATYTDLSIFEKGAKQYFDELTSHRKLQSVLAGTNLLYVGIEDKTPLYVHALIVNSYIESSVKCARGGDQIAKLLARVIKENHGEIIRKKKVMKIHTTGSKADYLELENQERIYADSFISNIHPAQTLELIDSDLIRPAYRKRIQSLENSIGAFAVYMKIKPHSLPYPNRNYYWFQTDDVWNATRYTEENWPLTYALFFGVPEHQSQFCETAAVMTYMRFDEVKPWEHTYNTTLLESDRGHSYQAFKKEKAEKLLSVLARKFPHVVENIESYYTSTPLSYRDYIGTSDGNCYGIVKDFKDPLKTRILPNTKIHNLLLTGQNVNLHGVLGVAMTSLITCGILLGRENLIHKILAANEVPV
jgi:all-trans-retinol 13,14-reductase